ncbi:hypothetical protein NLU14_12335 [Marinobacter sp. 71-i]|uniref:Uncharacterized protein n=1 Tax=Marinobacter iranensis TaxID=2962607 RepID=A0ABT5YBG4_9GAMM|nr:hypothetical protein [Marinobacter iranensis]MDF0751013.1 hypothetical protein [Marinobacter iranensis]
MIRQWKKAVFVALVACWPLQAMAEKRQPLDDATLHTITAGAAGSDRTEILTFDVVRTTRSGRVITADGSLYAAGFSPGIAPGYLNLSGGAQSGLGSVININAVNSAVNVLLNLNISIDSRIGAINQANLNGLPSGITGIGGLK